MYVKKEEKKAMFVIHPSKTNRVASEEEIKAKQRELTHPEEEQVGYTTGKPSGNKMK